MVGSPGQTVDTLFEDLMFIKELQPEMAGIGPFIPHKDTPFAEEPAGTVETTLRLLAIILYDNKICTGDEAAECKACMAARMSSIGYEVITARGDYIK